MQFHTLDYITILKISFALTKYGSSRFVFKFFGSLIITSFLLAVMY